MKTLLEGIIEGFVREYTDAEKQKIGIPLDAFSKGGKWYQGDWPNEKYIGKVVNGRFVRVGSEPEDTQDGETDSQAGTDQDNQDGTTGTQGGQDGETGSEDEPEDKPTGDGKNWRELAAEFGNKSTIKSILEKKVEINTPTGRTTVGRDGTEQLEYKKTKLPFGEDVGTILDMLADPKKSREEKQQAFDAFVEKYQLYSVGRAAGAQLYHYDRKTNGRTYTFGKKPSTPTKFIADRFAQLGFPLPTDYQISDGKKTGPRYDLFTSEVMVGLTDDTPADAITIERDEKTGRVTRFAVDGKEVKWIDPERARTPENRVIIEMYNQQLQEMGKLIKDGEIQALVLTAEQGSVRVQELINKSIDALSDVSDEAKQAHTTIIQKMTDAETVEEFDNHVREYFKFLTTFEDENPGSGGKVLDMSKAYLTESIAILRETKRGSTIIIPTASDFPVGDFVALGKSRGAGRLPMLVEVSLDGESATHPELSDMGFEFASIKFGSGAESAQFGKIKLHSYEDSDRYGSGEEIKNLLLELTESGEGTLFSELFNENNEDGLNRNNQRLEELYGKFGDLICKYHGVEPSDDNLSAIRQCFTYGRTPETNKDGIIIPCDKEDSLHRGKKGQASLRKCSDEQKDRWDAHNQMSAIIDVINNSFMKSQAYSNLGFYRSGTIKETTGGVDVGGKATLCQSKGNPAKTIENCKPRITYAAGMVPTDVSEMPSKRITGLLEQEIQLSPREQQLQKELKKLVRDIAINRLGDYGN